MKKRVLSILLAGVMAFSLAACGGGSDEGDQAEQEGGGNKLTVFAWDPAFNIPALEAAAADYKENVNPDFELEILEQARQHHRMLRQRLRQLHQQATTATFRIWCCSRITTSRDMWLTIRMHGHRSETSTSTGMISQLRSLTTPRSTASITRRRALRSAGRQRYSCLRIPYRSSGRGRIHDRRPDRLYMGRVHGDR